ncbi:pH-response regulator protein palI/RIM9 [Cephus cinctus]|uniref:PH-response regulator protein palI/RIM9 n=1 Tax=Cephus cinctus TaxID=211228 RepID=A0AAJ7C1I0_CEPCN|nr:pH-response regulator protein palI/RIM9 [Cephus cinctus]
MGEPKSAAPPQPNGGVKQKPTSLNLALGALHRSVNGRLSLNDRHLQHVTAAGGGVGVAGSGINGSGTGGRTTRGKSTSPNPACGNESLSGQQQHQQQLLPALPTVPTLSGLSPWGLPTELETVLEPQPPPPPAPSSHSQNPHRSTVNDQHQQQHQQQQRNNLQSSPINQLPTRSPSHSGNGFPLYTPPAPIPASGANKVRSTPNGLPQSAPRRPHSIAAPPYHGVNVGVTGGGNGGLHPLNQFTGRQQPPPPPPPSLSAGAAAAP